MSSTVSFQVLSDLHLEIDANREFVPSIPPLTPYLALCGDIGDPASSEYRQFILDRSSEFERVLVLTGNHEFYGHEYHETKRIVSEFCAEIPNVDYLDISTGTTFLDSASSVRFIGTTLWTRVDPGMWQERIGQFSNDYRKIRIVEEDEADERRLQVTDTVRFHAAELEYLLQEVQAAKERNETVVVLTHHSPVWDGSFLSPDDRFLGQCRSTRLEGLCRAEDIQLWAFGHTHASVDFRVGGSPKGTRVYANQFGYQYRQQASRYDPESVVEILSRDADAAYLEGIIDEGGELATQVQEAGGPERVRAELRIYPNSEWVDLGQLGKSVRERVVVGDTDGATIDWGRDFLTPESVDGLLLELTYEKGMVTSEWVAQTVGRVPGVGRVLLEAEFPL